VRSSKYNILALHCTSCKLTAFQCY